MRGFSLLHIYYLQICFQFNFTMAPRVKDPAWKHCDVIDDEMYCKYCKKHITGGGICTLNQHLAAIRSQVKPYNAPLEEIGQIRLELQSRFENFEENKAKQKEIDDEIGRKRELAATKANLGVEFEFEGSSSIPSTNVMDPFRYIPLPLDRQPKKRKNIKSYFTPSPTTASASASQPTQTQPTLDAH
jgi:hypothetical protein